MGTLYWSIVALALGGCIGSFLNVVIYRGAVGLSIGKPARSFCPLCRKDIAWYDNIPVLSYLLLRARCRQCGAPISLQYPIVELTTAFVFLLTYDAFFEARLRMGIGASPTDAIMLVAHWVLFSGLIVLTVMDLEVYMIDIRVTWLLAAVGVVAHTCWTPAQSQSWIRPDVVQAAWAWMALIGLGLGMWWFLRRQPAPPPEPEPPVEGPPPVETPTTGVAPSWRWLWLLVPVGLVVAYLVIMVNGGSIVIPPPAHGFDDLDGLLGREWALKVGGGASLRLLGGLALLFIALAAAATQPQVEADAQIVEAIETEAPDARRMALSELKLLAPAIVLCLLATIAVTHHPSVHDGVQHLLAWRAFSDWRPVLGLSTGLTGWVIGGAIAWLARIIFTFAFGKEALGMGDVHIMAAAGAIAGWPVALLGFFLAAMLGLLALPVIYLRRQSRVLSYGPWLALGFFLAAMFQDWIFEYSGTRWMFQ